MAFVQGTFEGRRPAMPQKSQSASVASGVEGLRTTNVPIVDEVYILLYRCVYLVCIDVYIYIFFFSSVVEKGRDSILCITTLQTIKIIIDDCTMYTCFLYIIAITAFFRG